MFIRICGALLAAAVMAMSAPALAQSARYDLSALSPQVRLAVEQARAAQVTAIRAAVRNSSGDPDTIGFTGEGGDTYQGEGYVDGVVGHMRDGHGLIGWSDGEYYAGQFLAADNGGAKHGFGVYAFADGRMYEGQWLKENYHGYGVEWSADGGVVYAGRWRNGEQVP